MGLSVSSVATGKERAENRNFEGRERELGAVSVDIRPFQ